MKIGTCDCCNTPEVELSRSEMAGMETWSCTDGCPSPDQLAKIMDGAAQQRKKMKLDVICRARLRRGAT